MIRFFKSPQPAALFLVPLIILILWAQAFMHCQPVVDSSSLDLWKLLASLFGRLPSWLNFILVVSMVSLSAIYLNQLCNKHEVLYKHSYLPALVYALFISARPEFLSFHPIHFVNLILLRVFDKSFSLFKNESATSSIFDSCFLAATASLLYFPAIVVIPLLIITVSLLRQFNFREWILMFLGFGLPFFFMSVWMFWRNDLLFFWKNYTDRFTHLRPEINIAPGIPLYVLAGLIGLWLFLSLFKLRMNYLKNVIRTRSVQQVLFLFLLFGSASVFLQEKLMLVHFTFIAIPLAVFCAYYLLSAKKRLQFYEIFLWLVIGTIVWNHLS